MRLATSTAVLALACSFAMPGLAQEGQPAAVPVGTVVAELRPVARALEFVGRIEAIEQVEVRARVKGYLQEIMFKEGDRVRVGDLLYRIEKDLFRADVRQAEGALERSKAALTLAIAQRHRAVELMQKSAGTVVARDQAVALEGQAKGAILTDEANLATAKINLGYTDIVSPINGRISKTNVTIGNVVGPESGVLTRIVSEDPIYVTFPVSQREFLRAQQSGRSPEVTQIKVRLRFADGSVYPHEGRINFVDISVDRLTDTILARASVANPSGALFDGQLMRVMLEAGIPEQRVMIPQTALIADQGGTYVFVVEDGKAVPRRVKMQGARGTETVLESGLNGGETIIVDGLQRVRPGIPVKATPMAAAAQSPGT
jgi:membrane fusion protein (multidrug efflux system)